MIYLNNRKISEIKIGEGGSSYDWQAIGYNAEPSLIGNGYNYAVEIKNSWDAAQPKNTFVNDDKLVFFPDVDLSNITDASDYFSNCHKLMVLPNTLFTNTLTNITNTFLNCGLVERIPNLTVNTRDFNETFVNCYSLKNPPLITNLSTDPIDYIKTFENCRMIRRATLQGKKIRKLRYTFSGCDNLEEITFEPNSEITEDCTSAFQGCRNLKKINNFKPTLNSGYRPIYFDSTFNNCSSLVESPEIHTAWYNLNNTFLNCTNLKKVNKIYTDYNDSIDLGANLFYGCVNLERIEQLDVNDDKLEILDGKVLGMINQGLPPFIPAEGLKVRYMYLNKLGLFTKLTACDFSTLKFWGVNDSNNPDAKDSVINTLLTSSHNRATAGFPVCTITLSPETKGVLTPDEIAQIEAKGYKIA